MNGKRAKTRGWTLNRLKRWWVPVDFLDGRLVAGPICSPFWIPRVRGDDGGGAGVPLVARRDYGGAG